MNWFLMGLGIGGWACFGVAWLYAESRNRMLDEAHRIADEALDRYERLILIMRIHTETEHPERMTER